MRNLRLVPPLVGILCGLAIAQHDAKSADRSVAILQKSRNALKQLLTTLYVGELHATGSMAEKVPTVEGRAVLGRRATSGAERYRAELALQPIKAATSLQYTIGSDGDVHFAIDKRTKVIYENPNIKVLGTYGKDLLRFLMDIYSDPDPFAKELQAETFYLGEETVGTVKCQKVRVKSKDSPDVIWSIGKTDHYPRKRVEVYSSNSQQTGTVEMTVTMLMPNPRWTKDPFTVVTDPTYTKTSVFAP